MVQKSLRPKRPVRDNEKDNEIAAFAHGATVSSPTVNKAKPKKAPTRPYSFSLTDEENSAIESLRTKGQPDTPILNKTDIIRLGIYLLNQKDQQGFSEAWQAYKDSEKGR